jgi:hypothetical protein
MAKTILIVMILAGILMAPDDLSSCGPFFPEALFAPKSKPFDAARYYGGRLDIIQPHYEKIYLLTAYRYLAGLGLSAADQAALLEKAAQPDPWGYPDHALDAWLRARVLVGAPALDRVDRFKLYEARAYILNCGDDAFRHAAETLGRHFQAGFDHDELRAWVAAQDQVFENCAATPGGAAEIPPPAAAGAPPWMQADRAYQIAAAEFYAGEFDTAAAEFRRIAADRVSPWHGIAPYLAGRALIRKTTLVDPAVAPAARDQLQNVLADPDAAQWHASARDLLRYLQVQTDPQAALREAAHEVETQRTGVAQSMHDYRLLLDHYGNQAQNPPRDDAITDWLQTLQYDPKDHALERWRATHALTWLVAALTNADKPNPEIMAAAAGVAQSSPAYLTVQFHRLRLLPADEARPRIEQVLARQLPAPARNQFLAERMRVASSWDDLLRYAPRTEAATVEGGFQVVLKLADHSPAQYFDADAARILDRQAPLAVLLAAAGNLALPPNLQLEVARAVWVRAILLNNPETARAIAPLLGSLAPGLKPYLDGYVAAADETTRSFATAWLLLNNPGMRPSIDYGLGRATAASRIDDFRDNWWAQATNRPWAGNAPLQLLYQGAEPKTAFVTPAESAAVRGERERMDAFPAAPTFMAREAVAWAGLHPDDPRVPESLRLAVRAARFACAGDGQTDRWSRRAFDLLHTHYAKTEAARRTPYWYKVGIRPW